jgi:OmpA-OmpF porin, OOP family
MKQPGQLLLWTIVLPISLSLGVSGCATKKFARQQAATVNQRVSKMEIKTNEELAALNHQQRTDISQVNERISTTDMKVSQAASAAQQANSAAMDAQQQAQANKDAISKTTTDLSNLSSGVANALNYQLAVKSDVTFGFDKSTLTPAAKSALDQIAQKAQSLPRMAVELTGFTDRIGSPSYNLALSRRRAEAVQGYLVRQKVPLRSIHILGLGEEAPPPDLEADLSALNPKPSKQEINRLARRVSIRVYGAGDITKGTASRSDDPPSPSGNAVSPDGTAPSPDDNSPSPDANSPSPDVNSPSPDVNSPSPGSNPPPPDARN